ncbi:hypothetical protein BGY98DRAFT_937371 [Russula aff. rugulosa BPL654]|nr:hypothetical protein BGY98DRAFT_937371 [Russula aff. rugulosa BPL654]
MRHWQEKQSALVSRYQYFASARHLSLSANPAIIQTTNDCISQDYSKCCMIEDGYGAVMYLHKTFSLELIESVLTNQLFRKQFSSQLETEADLTPAALIKLINGKADADEPGPGWMWVLAMEIMRGPGVVSGNITIPWQPTVAPAAPLAHASSPPSYPLQAPGHLTSHPTPRLRSDACSDNVVEMLAKAASGTGMIGTRVGQSVKTAAIKVQWRHTYISLACNTPFHFPTSSPSFLLTTNISDSIFRDDLGAMQTLARAAGFLAYPPHVYLRAVVAVAHSSWFVALEAFQDADYVLTTRGAATPGHVPDYLITQLAKVLQQESQLPLNESDDEYATTRLVCYAE